LIFLRFSMPRLKLRPVPCRSHRMGPAPVRPLRRPAWHRRKRLDKRKTEAQTTSGRRNGSGLLWRESLASVRRLSISR
jgi:hypothetical protein